MVSFSQHTAGCATEPRQHPGAARFAVGAGLAWLRRRWPRRGRADRRHRAVGLVMWNMRKIHFSHSWLTAAARMAVKGAPLSSAFIGAKRRPLTATAAEATRVSAPGCRFQPRSSIFNTLTPQQPWLLPQEPRARRFALNSLIPLALTHVNTETSDFSHWMAVAP